MAYIINDSVLGKGSYGSVYLGNRNDKQIAIKCCNMYDNGIENIIETSLMKSLLHPNINTALDIFCTPEKIYIIQELALMDLYAYTNINKNNHHCSYEELQHIFYSISQAVYVLHQQHFIHADIKSNNVLLFPNNIIKLTDFTLSIKKSSNDKKYTNTVCTPTHRPMECHMKQAWDESLDIWSLGCTFYEIAYHEPLFVNQSYIDKSLYDKKEQKEVIRQRYVNAIIHWASLQGQQHNYTPYDVDYDPNCNKNNILPLIIDMLHINPTERPTITEIVNNPMFTNIIPTKLQIITCEQNSLSMMEEARVLRYIEQCTSSHEVQILAYKIYTQLTLDTVPEYDKAIGCAWLASKMINNNVSGFIKLIPLEQILYTEREILHNLHFCLYF